MIALTCKYSRLLIVTSFLVALLGVGFAVLSSQQNTAYAISSSASLRANSAAAPATSVGGSWRINANGSQGVLNLTMINNVSLQGTITFNDVGGRVDTVTGSWNNATGEIFFTRLIPNGTTQAFTGFLGDNHPEDMLLAGSFTESDIASNASRTHFGWVAYKR